MDNQFRSYHLGKEHIVSAFRNIVINNENLNTKELINNKIIAEEPQISDNINTYGSYNFLDSNNEFLIALFIESIKCYLRSAIFFLNSEKQYQDLIISSSEINFYYAHFFSMISFLKLQGISYVHSKINTIVVMSDNMIAGNTKVIKPDNRKREHNYITEKYSLLISQYDNQSFSNENSLCNILRRRREFFNYSINILFELEQDNIVFNQISNQSTRNRLERQYFKRMNIIFDIVKEIANCNPQLKLFTKNKFNKLSTFISNNDYIISSSHVSSITPLIDI